MLNNMETFPALGTLGTLNTLSELYALKGKGKNLFLFVGKHGAGKSYLARRLTETHAAKLYSFSNALVAMSGIPMPDKRDLDSYRETLVSLATESKLRYGKRSIADKYVAHIKRSRDSFIVTDDLRFEEELEAVLSLIDREVDSKSPNIPKSPWNIRVIVLGEIENLGYLDELGRPITLEYLQDKKTQFTKDAKFSVHFLDKKGLLEGI